MIIADMFLLFRIEIEEKVLIAEFGLEYEEYKKKTKKLIPHLY
jgi:protein-S-isoprenylcysteine O-methyltransferase Ste14